MGFDVLDLAEALQHRLVAEPDGTNVHQEAALNTPSPALAHSAPVLEQLGDEGIGRNGRDGFVPVANLHGGEADLFNITVGVVARHLKPVTNPRSPLSPPVNGALKHLTPKANS